VVKGGKVKLKWEGVKDPSGVTYLVEIQHSDGSSGYKSPEFVTGLSTPTLAHTMTSSLERWRVLAVDGRGNRSAPSGFWTLSRAPSAPKPSTTTSTTYLLY
jgi:hypothetical protein